MGRPKFYKDETIMKLAPDGSSTLQSGSDRRAIVQFVLDEGGLASIGAINKKFGYDMSSTVKALVHSGWFVVEGGQK